MEIRDDEIQGKRVDKVEEGIYFERDHVDIITDLYDHQAVIEHEVGGHSKKIYFSIDLIDTSGGGYFLEGETQSGEEVIVDTGIGEYSIGGECFHVDNDMLSSRGIEFCDPHVSLSVSPGEYDYVIADKQNHHVTSRQFDVMEVEQRGTHDGLCETRIEGVTEDGDDITIEPENAYYEINKTYETFGPNTQVVTGSTTESSWESHVDHSATEPMEPIGFATYDTDTDDGTVELACDYNTGSDTITGELVLSTDALEEEFETEVTVTGLWDADSENEKAENDVQDESDPIDDGEVSFREDIVYETY